MPDEKTINTGGGAYVGGSVKTNGGKFVGRDDYSTSGASATEMAQAFTAIYAAIEARPNTGIADKADLKAEVQEVQTEAVKGDAANEDFLARHMRNIRRMAPDILEVMVDTLAGPTRGVATIIRKVMLKARSEVKE